MVASNRQDQPGLLSRDDLFLLMESYRNTIELNTTLLEQQKLIIDGNKKLLESNSKICERIEDVAKKLDACTQEISKTHHVWTEKRIEYNAENSKEHEKLKGYLNILSISVGTLCIGIVGSAIKAVTIFASWSDQIQLIESIAKVVGAG